MPLSLEDVARWVNRFFYRKTSFTAIGNDSKYANLPVLLNSSGLLDNTFIGEPGTWTPEIEDTSGNSASVAGGSTDGFYIQIGNVVHAWATLRLAAGGSALSGLTSGDVARFTLPVTSANVSNLWHIGQIYLQAGLTTDYTWVVLRVAANTAYGEAIELSTVAANAPSGILVSQLRDASVHYRWSVTYRVA